MRRYLLIASLLAAVTASCEDAPKESPAAIELQGADGKPYAPLALADRKATVLIFLMHDCPVTNTSAPEMRRVAEEFSPQGVQFFGVYATETAGEIEVHRKEYSLPFPGLLDPKLRLARVAGATRVPEAAVFSPDGKLQYRGRIDDRAVRLGVTRPEATKRDLKLALEAVVAGKEPAERFTKSIGCYLPVD